MSSGMIRIPVCDSDEVVEVPCDDLPDLDDVIEILQGEFAPLDIWIQFAQEYFIQGKEDTYEEILHMASNIPQSIIDEKYADQRDGRVRVLNMLAGYYIEKAKKETEEIAKETQNSKANGFLIQAETISNSHPATFVSRGVMFLYKSEFDRANTQFDTACINDPKNIPAKLGKACILYYKKDYNAALNDYKDILKTMGSARCPVSVRWGMGLCHFQLGHIARARACFQRCIQLAPGHVNAYIALAVIELNEARILKENVPAAAEHIKNAMESLKTAYQLDPNHPMVLNHLANHFFYRNELDKVNTLSHNAVHNATVNEMKADSYYNLARVAHVQSNYQNASSFYFRCTQTIPQSCAPARFGLGQTYIQRGELDKAITEFAKILKTDKDNYETNKILGSLYAYTRPTKPEHALKLLRRAHELQPKDEEVLIEIGQNERKDFQAALTAFTQAEEIIDKKIQHNMITAESVPYQLYNNIASLQLKLGNHAKAEEYLMKAIKQANIDENLIEELQSGNVKSTVDPDHSTLVYNLARTYEEMRKTEEAKNIYISLAKQHPNYVECYLRLGALANEEGDIDKASLWCNVASQIRPKDPTSWAMLGSMYLKRQIWSKAQKQFEYIANNIDKSDIYTLIAMGNIFLSSVRPDLIDESKTEKHLTHALSFFEKALQIDRNNVYAALNIGAVLAEKGY